MQLNLLLQVLLWMGSFDRLWVAAHTGNVHGVRHELDMGAPIEGRDPLGHTALMEASKYGHSNAVQVLLTYHGANSQRKIAFLYLTLRILSILGIYVTADHVM